MQLVALIAFLSRCIWVLVVRATPVSDFLFYHTKATELAQGRGYGWYGHPTAFWPPGYPLFLSILYKAAGPSVIVAQLSSVLLWTITAVLAYQLGSRLGGRRVGLIAGLLVALYPDFIFYSSLLASENLFVALLSGAVLLLILAEEHSGRKAGLLVGAAGLLMGAGALTRASAMVVSILFVPLLLLVPAKEKGLKQRILRCAILLGCVALVVLPWLIRNQIVMGRPVFATEGGITLWIGNHHGASGGYDVANVPNVGTRDTVQGELKANDAFTALAVTFIVEHPGEWLALMPKKLANLFVPQPALKWNLLGVDRTRRTGLSRFEAGLAHNEKRLSWYNGWLQNLYWLLGVVGLLVAVVNRRSAALFLLVPVAYWIALSLTFGHGEPRYLMSVAPLLAPGVAYLCVLAVGRLIPGSSWSVTEPSSQSR
jgi:4-amino-4-deoxy-L-arabinose transferase-like glycosyltransferase